MLQRLASYLSISETDGLCRNGADPYDTPQETPHETLYATPHETQQAAKKKIV